MAAATAERLSRYEAGYTVECLCYFEERLEALARWWRQLVGESEGKEQRGIYPSYCCYTEDLHSMGQYLQAGRPQVAELFLRIAEAAVDFRVPESQLEDGFAYLDGLSLEDIQRAAAEGTCRAHRAAGRPLSQLYIPRLDEAMLGELLMFWMLVEVLSCRHLGLQAYDQPGVEAYKEAMQSLLRSVRGCPPGAAQAKIEGRGRSRAEALAITD